MRCSIGAGFTREGTAGWLFADAGPRAAVARDRDDCMVAMVSGSVCMVGVQGKGPADVQRQGSASPWLQRHKYRQSNDSQKAPQLVSNEIKASLRASQPSVKSCCVLAVLGSTA